MSKKDRLKAQKEKQDRLLKESRLQELEEIEEAKTNPSKIGEKYRSKAKKERHKRYEDIQIKILRFLMLIPLVYSAFYCFVTVSGIAIGEMEKTPKWVAYVLVVGMIITIAGVVFEFYKKYIVAFVIIVIGTIVYMVPSRYIVKFIQSKPMEVNPSYYNLDKRYMWYYYPILIVTFLAFLFALITVMKYVKRKKRIQYERDNAPVKSIIEE